MCPNVGNGSWGRTSKSCHPRFWIDMENLGMKGTNIQEKRQDATRNPYIVACNKYKWVCRFWRVPLFLVVLERPRGTPPFCGVKIKQKTDPNTYPLFIPSTWAELPKRHATHFTSISRTWNPSCSFTSLQPLQVTFVLHFALDFQLHVQACPFHCPSCCSFPLISICCISLVSLNSPLSPFHFSFHVAHPSSCSICFLHFPALPVHTPPFVSVHFPSCHLANPCHLAFQGEPGGGYNND